MESMVVPLLKQKTGNCSDVNNYCAIALSNVIFKILEAFSPAVINSCDDDSTYQFGF